MTVASEARGRLNAIQYLRAAAALMVVAFHVLGPAWTVGSAGVDVFFVISGFVIALVTNSPTVTPLGFAYDRAARILPLYWLCTLVLALAVAIAPALFPRLPFSSEWLVMSLAMLPAFKPGTSDVFPMLYQGWTLNYEAFFYVVALIAVFLPLRQRFLAISAILVAFLAAGHWFPSSKAWARVYTDPLLIEFLAGYAFGHLRLHGLRLGRLAGHALVAFGLFGFGLAAMSGEGPDGWHRILVWGVPAFCLVAGGVVVEDRGALPTIPLAGLIGEASYAIYLTHGLAISLLVVVWRRLGLMTPDGLDAPALAVATFGLCVAGGIVFHRLVEQPLQRRLKRRKRVRIDPAPAR
ncbi:acyltransferase family protein [Phreatobacter stygius]|uniref:Acyltransferase n=1 Tax=Phreatobacter stygius TaxID=1940610 RepID=A0A4D7B3S0_9HYPH|nr:acyltransferase [Phreatobacter stygius]QCI68144.1 acyltransferase [Phreatobacter stygius]